LETAEEVTEELFQTMKEVHAEVQMIFALRRQTRFGSEIESHSAIYFAEANFETRRGILSEADEYIRKMSH
jgi:hemoglobin-like flavoprotein